MRKVFILLLLLLFVVSCQTTPIEVETEVVSEDLAIQRAAVFLLIMRGEAWGKKELEAEIAYLNYLLKPSEEPDG